MPPAAEDERPHHSLPEAHENLRWISIRLAEVRHQLPSLGLGM